MHIDERDTLEFGVSGWSSDDYQNAVAGFLDPSSDFSSSLF